MNQTKYWKPKSLTWWSGVVMLVCGVVELWLEVYAPQSVVLAGLQLLWGDQAGYLIVGGLGTIGARGAIGDIQHP